MRPTAADVIGFVEGYLRVPEGRHVGEPMRLMDWQRDFLVRVYDNPVGTRRAILSVGRKNAKSTLVAALLLAHVIGPCAVPSSQVYAGALSRDQASVVFKLCAQMIRLNPELARHLTIRDATREMVCTLTGVTFRALSSDASTAHGLSPVAFVADEGGQIRGPTWPLFDALHSGQYAHATPIEFIISTQAETDVDWFSLLLDDALSANDPQTVAQVYTAPEGCALDDEAAWHAANPGLGLLIDAEAIRRDAHEAKRLPSAAARFRQYQLNQRVGRDAENRLITAEVFDSCAEPVPPYDGSPAWAALDLSEVKDMTALSVVWKSHGKWNVSTWAWLPSEGLADREQADGAPYVAWRDRGMLRTTPGRTIDPDVIAREVGEILDGFKIKALSFDRWRINILKAALQRAGRQDIERMLVEFQQSYRAFSPAVAATERLFIDGALRHGASPLLTMAFHNLVTVRDETGNRRPDKRQQRARIDPAVATIMALGSAASDTSGSGAPTFQVFFL